MTTSLILSTAIGLWPENEPKPYFKWYKPNEWCCTAGGDPCGYADTLEESLYRYAMICQSHGEGYGPVLDFLGDHVEDPLFIQSNP